MDTNRDIFMPKDLAEALQHRGRTADAITELIAVDRNIPEMVSYKAATEKGG